MRTTSTRLAPLPGPFRLFGPVAIGLTLTLLGSCAAGAGGGDDELAGEPASQDGVAEDRTSEEAAPEERAPEERAPGDDEDELFPERTGQPVPIASGGEDGAGWQVHAQESVEGTCILVEDELGELTEGCGFEVPNRHDLGFFSHAGIEGSPQVLAGVVVDGAATVVLELEGGETVEVEPVDVDADFPTSFFVADVTGREQVVAVVAVTASGEELQRRAA